jgi:hypothetical protein
MLPHDPTGKNGVAKQLPDIITISEPKEDAPVPVQPQSRQGFAQNVNPNMMGVSALSALLNFFFEFVGTCVVKPQPFNLICTNGSSLFF